MEWIDKGTFAMSGHEEESGGRRLSDDIIIILREQVSSLVEMVGEIKTLLGGDGTTANPGLLIRLDRLEQLEASRNVHRVIMYTTIVGLIIERVWHFLSLLGKP